MSPLLTDLMQNFVNKKSLFDVTDGVQVLKPVHSLVQLNLKKKESLKPKVETIHQCWYTCKVIIRGHC